MCLQYLELHSITSQEAAKEAFVFPDPGNYIFWSFASILPPVHLHCKHYFMAPRIPEIQDRNTFTSLGHLSARAGF